jgi:hypothetical protein
MGITDIVFHKLCKKYFSDAKCILELGAQHFLVGPQQKIAGYFSKIFNNYPITIIDMNGENGALKIDLSKDIDIKSSYDLITNFGTSEHVSDQYTCWKNIHALLSNEGIVISEIPEIGSWKGHCRYYVDYSFFKAMSEDFEIIDYRRIHYSRNGYLSFSILKKKSHIFLTRRDVLEKTIHVDNNVIDKISF